MLRCTYCDTGDYLRLADSDEFPPGVWSWKETYRCDSCGLTGTLKKDEQNGREDRTGCLGSSVAQV